MYNSEIVASIETNEERETRTRAYWLGVGARREGVPYNRSRNVHFNNGWFSGASKLDPPAWDGRSLTQFINQYKADGDVGKSYHQQNHQEKVS